MKTLMKTDIHFFIYHSVILRMRCVEMNVVGKIETSIKFSNSPPPLESRALCKLRWKNIVEPVRPHDNIVHAHCMLDTEVYRHKLKIRILIAFPLQQQLHERAATLHYTYTACIAISCNRLPVNFVRVFHKPSTDGLNLTYIVFCSGFSGAVFS
jgi:hypothetical protein